MADPRDSNASKCPTNAPGRGGGRGGGMGGGIEGISGAVKNNLFVPF